MPRTCAPPSLCSIVLITLSLSELLPAQCVTTWTQTMPAKPDGQVHDQVWWDPDGSGPAGPLLVFAGYFRSFGLVEENGFAGWDPGSNTFVTIATDVVRNDQFRSPGHALAVLANGDLVVAGAFSELAGQPIPELARFDGANWHALGTGIDYQVQALTVMTNGDLVATGRQLLPGGASISRLERWDGTAWHTLGTPNGIVEKLSVAPNGDLIAAGRFGGINGILVNRVARWNGSAWSALGAGLDPAPPSDDPSIRDLDVLPNGDVLVCGTFTTAGGAPAQGSARWDGATWSEMNAGAAGGAAPFRYFHVTGNGELLGVTTLDALCAWNGTSWSVLVAAMPPSWSRVTELPNGELFAAPDQLTPNVQRLMPPGTDRAIYTAAHLDSGELIVAGEFSLIEGVPANGIARHDGSGWQPYGGGIELNLGTVFSGWVRVVLPLPGGELIAGGFFNRAGGMVAPSVARWDGSSWSSMGAGLAGQSAGNPAAIESMVWLPDGTLVAGGQLWASTGTGNVGRGVASWNGFWWETVGGGLDGDVQRLAVLPDGSLVAGGWFVHAASGATNIARWDGTAWAPMGNSPWAGQHIVAGLLVLRDGTLVASGSHNGPAHIATWDGNTWTTIGVATSYNLCWLSALHELPNGDLLVGGLMQQIDGVPIQGLARWRAGTWHDEHADLDRGWERVQSILAVDDRLLVTGDFRAIGGRGCGFHAWLDTSCPAATTSIGASCASPAALDADLPWLGSVWHLRGHDLPTPTFVLAAHGTTAISLPLANVLAEALPGCVLEVLPDTIELAYTTAGTVTFAHALPDAPVLLGATFRSQLVPFGLDAAGALLTVTTTNAVEMTFGAF